MLVVDDDPEVHQATVFALKGQHVCGRPLELLHAYSAGEDMACLRNTSCVAEIFLDVVMEGHDDGLKMAQAGAGRFLDTNIDGRIPIDYLIGFATSEPWMKKNFYVTNLNANPSDDGSIDADSDADGLCDKDELRYNSEYKEDPTKSQRMAGVQFDPYNRNSFSATLSDAFYYKYIVYGEALPLGCTDTADSDSDLLNNCEEQFLKSTIPTGATQ